MIRIFLQFFEADKEQAMKVARLIADLEDVFNPNVELIFAHRFDCEPPENDVLFHCVQKMAVSLFRTSTRWYGWPAGCNAMALDCLKEARDRAQKNQWSRGDMVLLLEADACPLSRTWLADLHADWLQARDLGRILMGSWRNSGPECGHINGNCVVIPCFLNVFNADRLFSQHVAWDAAIAPYAEGFWIKSGLIKNCFQTQHISDEEIEKPEIGLRPAVLIHGIKSDDALNFARRKIT